MVPPKIIDSTLDSIFESLKSDYQERTGKVLHPGQAETLVFRSIAYQIYLWTQTYQSALTQMLVPFSSAPILDYLGQLVGVTRLSPKAATVDVEFQLVSGHATVVIPSGTRVSSVDGLAVFMTLEDVTVLSGTNTVTLTLECQTVGVVGNGYTAGQVVVILDPQAFLDVATNTITSNGGSNAENDDQLRSRILLAPNSFSVAGPSDAYKFFAKSANASIVDVAITQPVPGTVKVYPLLYPPIETPLQVLQDVEAACSPENIRPLCDTVVAASPDFINYTLNIGLKKLTGYDDTDLIDLVTSRLLSFTEAKSKTLGNDIVLESIIAQCMVEGVYQPLLNGFTTLPVNDNSVAVCTGVTVYIDSEHEA